MSKIKIIKVTELKDDVLILGVFAVFLQEAQGKEPLKRQQLMAGKQAERNRLN